MLQCHLASKISLAIFPERDALPTHSLSFHSQFSTSTGNNLMDVKLELASPQVQDFIAPFIKLLGLLRDFWKHIIEGRGVKKEMH